MKGDPSQAPRRMSVLDFQEMFAGAESMAIVGSASSVLQWQNGPHIDSFDIVVRFNRTTVEGMEASIGARTDIIVANDSNSLKKAPSPEFASKPKCVVAFVKPSSVGTRTPENRKEFLDWVADTPLFFCPGPETLCCDMPMRQRGFSMGTYALIGLPAFLNIKRLFVTGFTMFGESSGGSDHHTKKSSRASVTWHDADLERYVAANVLGNFGDGLTATEEVAEFMSREGFSASLLNGAPGAKQLKSNRGFSALWYAFGRVGKLLLTAGYHVRRFAERRAAIRPGRKKP
jgi:hypothetical protein